MRNEIFIDDFQIGDGGVLFPTDNVLTAETQTAAAPTAATAQTPTMARYTSPGARAKQETIIKANTPQEQPAAFEITGTHLLIGAAVLGVILYSLDD